MSNLLERKRKSLVIAALVLAMDDEDEQIKKRKWSKQWLLERRKHSHMNLLHELQSNEPADFKNYLRMENHTFYELLDLVRPLIEKQNTIMRESISAEERLVATLRFLATGRSYEDLKFSCAISAQALGKIIPETCWAIYEVLRQQYLKMPNSETEWKQVAKDFKTLWDFDNCLGAIDGKHVLITKPPNSGSYYFNYKGTFSVVLFTVVNANFEFIYVHCGTNGRVSDAGIMKETDLYRSLKNNELKIPPPQSLPQVEYKLPFVFIGDAAFPLMENLMKPYGKHNSGHDEHIFNYRLSRARRVVENAFVVMASCVLHNFLRKKSSTFYTSANHIDSEDTESGNIIQGQWRQIGEMVPLQQSLSYTPQNAKLVRDKYKEYFNNEGKVSFQEKMIHHR
ncbi:uncharacterized protein LOC103308774 [Acyrthosiphon pisum]|uniref:DDE Tnp4 domain-containing protein n=1 Tax=Acyrthosiphon pisum TaxID=7029 RepID=A0A8R2B479_ACYPI|nr:uncharacterized protein LOC103308774 [Acyrthosiphon pisum]|eukprot:XP_008181021.1 PREDICTED: uncharacterized protein LOC103308774 [Acyrthosiphon pisum]